MITINISQSVGVHYLLKGNILYRTHACLLYHKHSYIAKLNTYI